MESLSRPPHRRKHSTAGNAFSSNSSASSFSLKNPYDGVLLSSGGKAKLGAHEYAEIFSGSSSIPVLDLSCLEERLGSGDCRSSKLDYSNIFGGMNDDDVGVPYEELFNGAAKKTKTRIPADAESPSGKTKSSSSELSDQSMDGTKKHLNMSFNKTSQRINDTSNGTHIAQLHAVPGFTYFVDGTPKLHNTEADRSVTSLKREVSRTWSFSAGLETSKVKSGLNLEKSNVSANKDQSCSKLPSFGSSDFSGNNAEENSPPFIEEELDENSVAAVSAAALKKAIEQAQESIRIAKMIMERKKEGLQDGPKRRSKKVKDKKETGADEKYSSPLSHKEKFHDAGNAEVERVREDVEAAKEHGDSFVDANENFSPPRRQSETDYIAEKVDSDNVRLNVEGADTRTEGTYFTGLVSNAECGIASLESGEMESMETGTETLAERDPNTTRKVLELEKSVDEAFEQCRETGDSVREPENVAEVLEKVQSCSQSMHEKILQEEGENLRISQEDEAAEKADDVADDNGKCEEKIEKHEFNYLLNESRDEAEKDMLEQDGMEKKSEEENTHTHGESHDDEENGMSHIWFESEPQLKEPLEEEISERGPEIFPCVEVGEKVNIVEETEMDDKKLNYGHVEEGQKPPGEVETNGIAERHLDTSAYEAADTIQMESNNCAEVKKSEVFQDAERTNETLGEEPRSEEENQYKFDFQEAASEKYFDEAIDVRSYGSSSVSSVAQEPGDDLQNEAEEYQEAVKGNKEDDRLPCETESSSEIDNKEARKLFYLEVDEMPETDSLRRSASEENFIGTKLENAFETLSSDSNSENISSRDSDSEEKLSEDEETSGTFNKTHENAAADINMQNSPKVHISDNISAEFVGTKLENAFETLSSDSNNENISSRDSDSEEKLPEDEETSGTFNKTHKNAAADINMQNSPEVHISDNISAEFVGTKLENAFETLSSDSNSENISSRDSDSEEKLPEDEETSGTFNKTHENAAADINMQNSPEVHISDNISAEFDQTSTEGSVSTSIHENIDEMSTLESQGCDKTSNNTVETEREAETNQNRNKNKEKQKEVRGNEQNFEANERIEAIKKGRAREKDRIAVERAIREARERAFAEARERAGEKAAAEARQRAMAEAREKPADKASIEAKRRAERAAVERATAEARERALEKAMSYKTFTGGRPQPEGERSSSSRNNGLKHSYSSSDLEKFDGAGSESVQRRKARLERHQRIMERAAKALAEKNIRDILAQKEQAERNRLAESLDADIKRWSTGKEGNLRALLSTLQYILGQDSGWQPISLTEIITTAAVKKAYRKATLCVHPDKLQQRGASIQQKYICEKVFDLLKAAWNRFNSEER